MRKSVLFNEWRLRAYCSAPFFAIAFVCGVSPPPPLESRLQAGGVSLRHRLFFAIMPALAVPARA
jgi:hypothetical protein